MTENTIPREEGKGERRGGTRPEKRELDVRSVALPCVHVHQYTQNGAHIYICMIVIRHSSLLAPRLVVHGEIYKFLQIEQCKSITSENAMGSAISAANTAKDKMKRKP